MHYLYRTGDFGDRRSDGNVVCIGQRDRQLKLRGYRVDLGESKRAVSGLSWVGQFHVDIHASESETRLLLTVVPRIPDVPVHSDCLGTELARTLPHFIVPCGIVMVDRLAITLKSRS